jgi:hypothetical protein
MQENNTEIDFFGDSFRIFLGYISRQLKKNPDYLPHPLIRAFECALQDFDKLSEGERTMGLSQDGNEHAIYNPYIVVLEKKNSGIEVKEIRNLSVNKDLPMDVMIYVFRLQIKMDQIYSKYLTQLEMVEILNDVIPGNKFLTIGDKWKEARIIFRKLLEEGKIKIPNNKKLIDQLLALKWDTDWKDYPNNVRAFIGGAVASHFTEINGAIAITSPIEDNIEKGKVFDIVTQLFLGKSSEYLNPLK